jgi:hypothetical protein
MLNILITNNQSRLDWNWSLIVSPSSASNFMQCGGQWWGMYILNYYIILSSGLKKNYYMCIYSLSRGSSMWVSVHTAALQICIYTKRLKTTWYFWGCEAQIKMYWRKQLPEYNPWHFIIARYFGSSQNNHLQRCMGDDRLLVSRIC